MRLTKRHWQFKTNNCTYILFYTSRWKWAKVSKNDAWLGVKETYDAPSKPLVNSRTSRAELNQQEQSCYSKTSEKKELIIKTAADFMRQG